MEQWIFHKLSRYFVSLPVKILEIIVDKRDYVDKLELNWLIIKALICISYNPAGLPRKVDRWIAVDTQQGQMPAMSPSFCYYYSLFMDLNWLALAVNGYVIWTTLRDSFQIKPLNNEQNVSTSYISISHLPLFISCFQRRLVRAISPRTHPVMMVLYRASS